MNGPRGHSHSPLAHLVGMLAAAAVILVVLVLAGRSWGEALPLAALLACPLMMIGMVFMMGRTQGHGQDQDQQGAHAGQDQLGAHAGHASVDVRSTGGGADR